VIAFGAADIELVADDIFLRSQLGISLRMPGMNYRGSCSAAWPRLS
jgi:hypothetical protein